MSSGKEDDTDHSTESATKVPYRDPDDGRQRFLLELEFVQCLANPTYIHYWAQNRYFEDEAFIGYLKYLQYWQQPEYMKFIMYPHCLFFLELLQNANFRNAMAHPGSKELAHRQQFFFWKNYRNNRLKHILPRSLPEPPAPTAQAPSPSPASLPAPVPSISTSAAAAPALSPMQFVGPPGSALPKTDMRNSAGDRRKRNPGGEWAARLCAGLGAPELAVYHYTLAQQQLLWKQKSRVNWLTGGGNMKIFHSTLIRRSRNKIHCLSLEDGSSATTCTGISRDLVSYFSNLWDADSVDDTFDLLDVVQPCVTDNDNTILTSPFTLEAVEGVIRGSSQPQAG